MTKDLIEAITGRKTIRQFKSDEVPRATVARIIEAAAHAPSAGNIQPWHFFVVFSEGHRLAIANACNQPFVGMAPVVIVVCAVPSMSEAEYGERGRTLYCIQDTAAAVQNILLASYGYGLGACWTGGFDDDALRRAIGGGSDMLPVAVVPVGYPAEDGGEDARRPFERIHTDIV